MGRQKKKKKKGRERNKYLQAVYLSIYLSIYEGFPWDSGYDLVWSKFEL